MCKQKQKRFTIWVAAELRGVTMGSIPVGSILYTGNLDVSNEFLVVGGWRERLIIHAFEVSWDVGTKLTSLCRRPLRHSLLFLVVNS